MVGSGLESLKTEAFSACSARLSGLTFSMFCQTLRTHFQHVLPNSPDSRAVFCRRTCGDLLGPVGTCRDLSGPVGTCQDLSGPVGTCQDLLGPVGTCRDLSGPVGTCCKVGSGLESLKTEAFSACSARLSGLTFSMFCQTLRTHGASSGTRTLVKSGRV